MNENQEAAATRAQALRRARAARTRKIRRAVVSGAVALFVAAWLMIAIVLVSGHDPALAHKASATTVASTPSTPTTTTTTPTVSSVTTSQS
jgi:cytoskeletal protein RodZ